MSLQTRVAVLMHYREARLTTNSAKLVRVALDNSEIRLRGQMGKPMSSEGLLSEERQSVYLFPDAGSVELTREWVDAVGKPLTLIVPDGSWRQTKRVGRREPVLSQVPHVRLPAGPPSNYRLRREPDLHCVSTFEAIARAIGVIEGSEIQKKLEYLFDVMVERMLWGQGVLPKDECRYPIPQQAIDEFFIAGSRGSRSEDDSHD